MQYILLESIKITIKHKIPKNYNNFKVKVLDTYHYIFYIFMNEISVGE